MPKTKTTQTTIATATDLRTQLEDLQARAENLRERIEQTVDIIRQRDAEIDEDWGTLCRVVDGCRDVLDLLTQIDNLRDTGHWRFARVLSDLSTLPTAFLCDITYHMDERTKARCMISDTLLQSYLKKHTNIIENAIRTAGLTWHLDVERIQRLQQTRAK